jgi:hypothetical protein
LRHSAVDFFFFFSKSGLIWDFAESSVVPVVAHRCSVSGGFTVVVRAFTHLVPVHIVAVAATHGLSVIATLLSIFFFLFSFFFHRPVGHHGSLFDWAL